MHTRHAVLIAVAVLLVVGISIPLRERVAALQSAPAGQRKGSVASETAGKGASRLHDFPRHAITGATVVPNEGADPAAPPNKIGEYLDLAKKVLEKWSKTKVSINCNDAPLAQYFADLEANYGLKVTITADIADKTITFKVEQLAADQATDLILKMCDLAWTIDESGVMWVCDKADAAKHQPSFEAEIDEMRRLSASLRADLQPDPHAEANEAVRKAVETATITQNFTASSLYDILDVFSESTKVNIVISADSRRYHADILDEPRDLASAGMPMKDALEAALTPRGMKWTIENGVLLMGTAELMDENEARIAKLAAEKKARTDAQAALFATIVRIGGDKLTIRDVATQLGEALGVPVLIDPVTWRRAATFSIEVKDRPASEIVDILKKGAPLTVAYRDGKLCFFDPAGVP